MAGCSTFSKGSDCRVFQGTGIVLPDICMQSTKGNIGKCVQLRQNSNRTPTEFISRAIPRRSYVRLKHSAVSASATQSYEKETRYMSHLRSNRLRKRNNIV